MLLGLHTGSIMYTNLMTDISVARETGYDAIEFYIRAKVVSPKVREALEKVARMRNELENIQARKAQVKSRQTIDLAQVKLTAAEREMRRADVSIATNAISEVDYERARDELARARVEHEHAVQDAELEIESL